MHIKMKSSLAFRLCILLAVMFAGEIYANAPLRVGDTIVVRIGGVPSDDVGQISADYTVDSEGMINMPHIGRIRAVGMTAGELQGHIEASYRQAEIYTNPSITISQQGSTRTVNMGGEVKAPGRIPYTPDLTLLKAIIGAGDFTDYANQRRVRILRGGEVIVVDVKNIRKDPSKDIPLLPGDDILVPQSIF